MSRPNVQVQEAVGEKPGWLPNFAVILICQAFIFTAFSSVYPFMPLYLIDLGESDTGAMIWTGIIQAAGAGVLLVATPLWGALSDRIGKKPMVLRALVGASISVGLMGLATEAWHLVILRMIQGATSGTNSAIMALAVVVLPGSRLGMGMGFLQTAQFLGSSFGPLLGSVASAALGFRGAFVVAGIGVIAVAVLAAIFIREPRQSRGSAVQSASLASRLTTVSRVPRLRAPILAIFAFQSAYAVSATLLPLHVASVSTADEATTWVGVVLTAAALGVAAGAAVLGWLGGRVGEHRMALLSLLGTALLLVPQAWLTSPVQFVVLRAVLGFCAGGVLPSLRATLGHEAAADERVSGQTGAVYGLAQSAFAGGQVVGPPLASLVATAWGLPTTHLVSAALQGVAAVWYWQAQRGDRPAAASLGRS